MVGLPGSRRGWGTRARADQGTGVVRIARAPRDESGADPKAGVEVYTMFPQTSWSLVIAAANPTPHGRAALDTLLRVYREPVLAYIRRLGYDRDAAEDLTQGFFALLIERNDLSTVSQRQGRFRSWLIVALKHFLANQHDRETAKKRGGGQIPLSLSALASGEACDVELPDGSTPESAFQKRWAFTLLERVLDTLRQEWVRGQGLERFEGLKGFLTGDQGDRSYVEIASEIGMTAGAVRTQVYRLRKRYRAILRAEVAQTVATADEVEEEIRDLLAALRS